MNYNICIVQPDGYIHSAAFAELAELLAGGLQDMGHAVATHFNRLVPEARNVLVGCHLLNPASIRQIPRSTVIVNTEQVADKQLAWSEGIFEWARNFETWDYSERNISKLREMGAKAPKLLRIGFHRKLVRIPKPPQQDIDILFYGSMNDRRHRIIDDLRKTGRSVHAVFGVYGRSRDQLIARAKVLLNMHFYESQIFEVVRVFYLMTNSKAVVSEVGDRTAIDGCYLNGIRPARYEALVDSCLQLVADEESRIALESSAFESIQRLPQRVLMQSLFD